MSQATSISSAPAATDCDVLVIGGGPSGSTAAALLARQGRHVVLVEKAHHPRFHIGESLLLANVALFDRLGVREQVERIGMPKWGVEFVSPQHEAPGFGFIYRMTNPAMRELFMGSGNALRAKEAVISVLAGDVFGRAPIRPSLQVFKGVYYAMSLRHWRRSWSAWRGRSEKVRAVGAVPGESIAVESR